MITRTLAALALSLLATSALSAPALRGDVAVSTEIVTVGDLFDDAGPLAERALFRAPAPGTAGNVGLGAIRAAALKAGIERFDNPGYASIRVARNGIAVEEPLLRTLMSDELSRRGLLPAGTEMSLSFTQPVDNLFAADGLIPVRLDILRFDERSGSFAARFSLAGRDRPIDLNGRIDFFVRVAHLKTDLPAGAILSEADVELQPVPMRQADAAQSPAITDLIGKQLQRPGRAGLLLRAGDVAAPHLVARNQAVTLVYRSGPLTITVKGKALADAAEGETVSVLNLMSKKSVQGIAIAEGTVAINADTLTLAGL